MYIVYARFVRSFPNIISKISYTYFENISLFFTLHREIKTNCDKLMDCIFMSKTCYIAIALLIRILIDEINCLKIKSTK